MKFLLDTAIGAVTGIISGFGVGGGTLLVLYLTLFGKESQLTAQGINLIYFIPCAILALISHIKNRQVDFRAWLISGSFGTLAALLSAYVATRLDTTLLGRIFGGFLALAGVWEIISVTKEKRLEKRGR